MAGREVKDFTNLSDPKGATHYCLHYVFERVALKTAESVNAA